VWRLLKTYRSNSSSAGKAAEKIQDFTTINLVTAERLAGACEKAAAAERVQISIMVLDNDGNHVYMDRMDAKVISI